jgi:PPP family 3-phenylpropionic acid transporter
VYRFALLYFFFFGAFGTYVPWMPPFLESRGLGAAEIGLALAAVQAARALLPPAWGWLADRLQAPRGLLVTGAGTASLALLSMALPGEPGDLVLRLILYGVMVVPAMPLLETLTLGGLAGARQRYGPIRMWGSVGFIVAAWGTGALVPVAGLAMVPWACAVPLFCGAAWAMLTVPPVTIASPRQPPRLRELPWAYLVPLVAAAAMAQLSHGPYYAFFTLELRDRGISTVVIGLLWALAVVAEIGFMAVSPKWLPRIGLARALRWGTLLTAVRWLTLGSSDALWLVAVSQLLHAASYAAIHLATLQLVDAVTPAHSKATAQSMLSGAVWGLGVGLGLVGAGQGLAFLGYDGLYLAATAVAILAFGLAATAPRRPG